MYPSGRWVGHWDQVGMGRQSMHDLKLQFAANEVFGQGYDCIGEFSLVGQVHDDFTVRFIKTYRDRHSVIYQGIHDGEGVIHGVWALASDHGTFALSPKSGFVASQAPIPEHRP